MRKPIWALERQTQLYRRWIIHQSDILSTPESGPPLPYLYKARYLLCNATSVSSHVWSSYKSYECFESCYTIFTTYIDLHTCPNLNPYNSFPIHMGCPDTEVNICFFLTTWSLRLLWSNKSYHDHVHAIAKYEGFKMSSLKFVGCVISLNSIFLSRKSSLSTIYDYKCYLSIWYLG